MQREEFLAEIKEIMQRNEAITGNESLAEIEEWDSMTVLGVMSFFDMEFGIDLNADQMKALKTMQELIALAGNKITN